MENQQPSNNIDPQVSTPDRYIVTGLMRPHKNMLGNGEGGHKTQTCGQLAVCVAAGMPFLGLDVEQGSVMIVDEETRWEDLDFWLNRFALGLGHRDWRELPIVVKSKQGFRFSRRTELDRLIRELRQLQPEPTL
ncbi:MAG: AAA family ATPase, partial [Candidatus Latescibacteria bacterium]|nr:AAA family ATPase [Candidatus Latescibacterota bacterium]